MTPVVIALICPTMVGGAGGAPEPVTAVPGEPVAFCSAAAMVRCEAAPAPAPPVWHTALWKTAICCCTKPGGGSPGDVGGPPDCVWVNSPAPSMRLCPPDVRGGVQ